MYSVGMRILFVGMTLELRAVAAGRGRRAIGTRAALFLALATLALLVSATAALAAVAEVEPNNTRGTANGPFTGDQRITGSLRFGDVDFFRINVPAATGYSFSTPDDDGGNGCSRGAEDPVLDLYSSRGLLIGSDDDGGGGLCAMMEGKLAAGKYFVAVSPFSGGRIPDYTLKIDAGASVPPACSDDLDNDRDGSMNFPGDEGCSSPADDDERDPARERCTIEGSTGNDILRGGRRDDVICGGLGNDTIRGGAGDDILRGGLGNDTLRGDSGDDYLFGGPGNDNMLGGPGDDSLVGGRGRDIGSD